MNDEVKKGARPLSSLLDALLRYAISPSEWQQFLNELADNGRALEEVDPQELLSQLSRAESVAWNLRGQQHEPALAQQINVSSDGAVVSQENTLPELGDYLTAVTNAQLTFTDERTLRSWRESLKELNNTPTRAQVLVVLHAKSQRRFGYATKTDAGYALLIPGAVPSETLASLVKSSFALTDSETRLVMRLATGAPLKSCAAALNISVNTARNHLQSVFDKSGIKRQSDLILVVTQLGVMLAGVGKPAHADAASIPADHQFILLDGGRRLAYRSYGNATGQACLYLHETVGSSLLLPGTDKLCKKLGLFLIAVERPGAGFSDSDANMTFASVAQDNAALLRQLNLTGVVLLGHMSGAAHALSLAAVADDQISGILCVNSRLPGGGVEPNKARSLNLITGRLLKQPWLLRTFFNILRNRASDKVNRDILKSVCSSASDKLLFSEQPAILDHVTAYTQESMTVTAAGMASELTCFASDSLAELDDVRMPMHFWHAADSAITSADSVREFLGQDERPERTLDIRDGGGTMMLYARWEEALTCLKQIAESD